MLAIVSVDIVFWFKPGTEPDHGRLFSEIEVAIAANFRFGVHLARFLFKATNEQHLVIVAEQRIAIFPLGERSRYLLRCRWSSLYISLLFTLRVHSIPDPFVAR